MKNLHPNPNRKQIPMRNNSQTFLFLFLYLSLFSTLSYSLPLSTRGRWIIDSETGHRVKLVCVNWPSHTQSMLIEGLDRRPLKDLADEAVRLRFNCVRLTYATHMFIRYANRTIEENFDLLDLKVSKKGLAMNNPFVLKMTIFEAYEAVVELLGESGLMVIADNHISQPRWCSSIHDGNGFFGDRYFDTQEWLLGLRLVAHRFYNKSTVVAMSLRNEIRGERENCKDWNNYMSEGVKEIHSINPQVLVIVSGLNYDNDLRCMKKYPIAVRNSSENKLVFEVHLYSFSGDSETKFIKQPLNKICGKIINEFKENAGFVMNEGNNNNEFPLFVSEYGYDQTDTNEAQNRFMSCFLSHLAKSDMDWSLWSWQGSYYYREGQSQSEERFGVLNSNWTQIRNPHFPIRFQLLQTMLQDPNSNSSSSHVLYHPESGQCVHVNNSNEICLNNCSRSSLWSHDGDGAPIRLENSGLCLKANGDGVQPSLSSDCLSQNSSWRTISDTKLHIATLTQQGNTTFCLEKESKNSSRILTRSCTCIGDDSNCLQDTRSQWFQFVATNTM